MGCTWQLHRNVCGVHGDRYCRREDRNGIVGRDRRFARPSEALLPASATITAGGSRAYTAEGRDQYDNSLGDVTASTTFSIGPNGSCTGANCTATLAGTHTVTGSDGGKTGTASLSVTAGAPDHLVLAPASATVAAGGSQAYTAEGRDQYNNSLGDVTSSAAFSISPEGSCLAATCTASAAGIHTVTGSLLGATGTASLQVTACPRPHRGQSFECVDHRRAARRPTPLRVSTPRTIRSGMSPRARPSRSGRTALVAVPVARRRLRGRTR